MTTLHTPIIPPLLPPEHDQIDHHNTNLLSLAMTALRMTNLTTFGSSKSEPQENVLLEISMDEVSNHCTINDCWIIIYDRVYDVTKFIKTVNI